MADLEAIPAPVVAIERLPAATRGLRGDRRVPGFVGARSRSLIADVGLGLGARRRTAVTSIAATYGVRPPAQWRPGLSAMIDPVDADPGFAWNPWAISDRLAPSTGRWLGAEPVAAAVDLAPPPSRPTVSARPQLAPRSSAPAAAATPPRREVEPTTPAARIDADDRVEFAPTGHDAGSKDDMFGKLLQLESLRNGRPPVAAAAPVVPGAAPPPAAPAMHSTPVTAPRPVVAETSSPTTTPDHPPREQSSTAWPTDPPGPDRGTFASPSAARTVESAPPAATDGSRFATPSAFLDAWEAPLPPTASADTVDPAPVRPTGEPERSRPISRVPETATRVRAEPSASAPSPNAFPSGPIGAWPDRQAPEPEPRALTARTARTTEPARPRGAAATRSTSAARTSATPPAPAQPAARLDADDRIEFAPTGHEPGTSNDMFDKLLQLDTLRRGRPPAAATPPARPGEPSNAAPTASRPSTPATSPTAAPPAPGAAPPAPGAAPVAPGTTRSARGLAWPGDTGAPATPDPVARDAVVRDAVAPAAPTSSAAGSPVAPPTNVVSTTSDADPVAPAAVAALGRLSPLRTALAESGPLGAGPIARSPRSANPSGVSRSATTSTPQPASGVVQRAPADPASVSEPGAPTTVVDRPAAPPDLATRFLHQLSERRRDAVAPLPTSFEHLAPSAEVATTARIATGPASRAALGAVGRRAATIGTTVHLAGPLRDSAADRAVIAHELEHVASPSTTPRFFDDPVVDEEERRARRAGTIARQASRDERRRPASAVRRRSVVGQGVVVNDRTSPSARSAAPAAGGADVVRRTPASPGPRTVSAVDLAREITQGTSSPGGPSRGTPTSRAGTTGGGGSVPGIQRAAEGASVETSSPESKVDTSHQQVNMDELVDEVERRLARRLMRERTRLPGRAGRRF